MMVGHCQSHPHHHRPRSHYLNRSGSESSREYEYNNSGGRGSTPASSDYSLTMSSETGYSSRHHSTASLIDTIERRTQRTYRYGIGLVCVGATLNWLGFAQGTAYIDPLRYLGVACVLTGSFCVCLAMCRWLGRPISVSGHRVTNLEEDSTSGDVHVINVAVPIFVPSLHEEYRPTKPPDYEQIVAGEPPPYDEAIKLSPGALFTSPAESSNGNDEGHTLFPTHFTSSDSCQPTSPSHNHPTGDLTSARLLSSDQQEGDHPKSHNSSHLSPERGEQNDSQSHISLLQSDTSDPPPAYEPSPKHSIICSSSSSNAPLIPTSTSRFELPPSFSVKHLFGSTGTSHGGASPDAASSRISPQRMEEVNLNEHLHEAIHHEDSNSRQTRNYGDTPINVDFTIIDDTNGNPY